MENEQAPNRLTTLPTDPKERKKYPIFSGVLAYFPDAIAAVARVSFEGNEQHNPGEPLHWTRGKSMDQEDTLVRHLMESGGGNVGTGFDTDGQRHSAKAAWRALAKLQLEIEADREKEGSIRLEPGMIVPVVKDHERCTTTYIEKDAYLFCSLQRGHTGAHVAHELHDLTAPIMESWTTQENKA